MYHERKRPIQLSPREAAIVQAVSGGATNREIALDLGISEQTVKNHLHNAFRKLGVFSRTQAVTRAAHLRLIQL
ncbi:MAG: response regulator transcription factor [Chloroflexi bacterium]|nr:response regulator transcription factor [Chloroflexota bacterium]